MPEADDTDARFRELIEAEYGIEPDAADPLDDLSQDRPEDPGAVDAPFVVPNSALPTPRSWTPPEEGDEPFVPPPVEPFGRISTIGMLALILLVAAAVVGVFTLAQLPLPWWGPPAGLVCFLVGLGLAFSRLPKDRPPDSGAVV